VSSPPFPDMLVVPALGAVSPLSSTFSVSLPVPPRMASRKPIPSTVPPSVGARLPTLIVSLPAPALIVVTPAMVCTLITSLPRLRLDVGERGDRRCQSAFVRPAGQHAKVDGRPTERVPRGPRELNDGRIRCGQRADVGVAGVLPEDHVVDLPIGQRVGPVDQGDRLELVGDVDGAVSLQGAPGAVDPDGLGRPVDDVVHEDLALPGVHRCGDEACGHDVAGLVHLERGLPSVLEDVSLDRDRVARSEFVALGGVEAALVVAVPRALTWAPSSTPPATPPAIPPPIVPFTTKTCTSFAAETFTDCAVLAGYPLWFTRAFFAMNADVSESINSTETAPANPAMPVPMPPLTAMVKTSSRDCAWTASPRICSVANLPWASCSDSAALARTVTSLFASRSAFSPTYDRVTCIETGTSALGPTDTEPELERTMVTPRWW